MALSRKFVSSYATINENKIPREGPGGGLSRECVLRIPSVSLKATKGAVCRNHRIKRLVPCRSLDGHVKESYEMSMALGARP